LAVLRPMSAHPATDQRCGRRGIVAARIPKQGTSRLGQSGAETVVEKRCAAVVRHDLTQRPSTELRDPNNLCVGSQAAVALWGIANR